MQVFNVYLYTIETYTDAFSVYEQVLSGTKQGQIFSGSYEGASLRGLDGGRGKD